MQTTHTGCPWCSKGWCREQPSGRDIRQQHRTPQRAGVQPPGEGCEALAVWAGLHPCMRAGEVVKGLSKDFLKPNVSMLAVWAPLHPCMRAGEVVKRFVKPAMSKLNVTCMLQCVVTACELGTTAVNTVCAGCLGVNVWLLRVSLPERCHRSLSDQSASFFAPVIWRLQASGRPLFFQLPVHQESFESTSSLAALFL
eukprot:1158867-Pelagomonas_calceolata.AAC.28